MSVYIYVCMCMYVCMYMCVCIYIYIILYNYNRVSLMHVPHLSFQPVLHDWCNKGRGMCYPVCGMVHIKEPLLLIGKRQRVSFLTIGMVLNHMSDAI